MYLSKIDFVSEYNQGVRTFKNSKGDRLSIVSMQFFPDFVHVSTNYSKVTVSNNAHAIYRIYSLWQNGEIE